MLRAVFALSLLPMLASAQSDSIAPGPSNMSTQTASEFVKGMAVGWNVGNSLEAGGAAVPQLRRSPDLRGHQ